MRISDAAGLIDAIRKAEPHEEIILAAGRYEVSDLKIRRHLSLTGVDGHRVVLFSSGPVAKGLLNPLPGVSLRVANITFRGAHSPDKNGAGIRHDGMNLTVENCAFENNENAILATGAEDGEIIISKSSFIDNGHGDGYSHGIYVVRAAALTITDSRFVGVKIGHHVKSLAARTQVLRTVLDDAQGRASYAIDASKGGDVTIVGNTITQAADASNRTMINYDLTRGGEALGLRIEDNRLINFHRRGKLLRNDTSLTPVVTGNEIINKNQGNLSYQQQAIAETKMQLRQTADEATAPVGAPAQKAPLAPPRLETPAPKTGKRSGLLRAPKFNREAPSLAAFKLANNWKASAASDYLTFGQAFIEGALIEGDHIAAQFGDHTLAAQLDVKALHQDGSVRHAAITIETPPVKSGGEIEGALIITPAPHEENFDAVQILTERFDFLTSLTFYDGDGASRSAVYNPRDLVIQAFRAKTPPFWLNGALAKETRVEMIAGPHLTLRFDVRVYRDGDIRTNVVFANEKTFSPGRREMLYDVVIGGGSGGGGAAAPWRAEQVFHHRSSTWRKIFWTGAQPKLHIAHDLETLIAANAIAPLDASQGVSGRAIAANLARLSDDPKPLSPALVTPYFPTTGGRGDLGLYTRWGSHFLVTQTQAAKRVMLANADAAGAIPWHFKDEKTGAPVSLETRKKFWADPRGLEARYAPDRAHPDLFASHQGGWTPDHSHKPALSYVPYLVTADRYYAGELAMQGAYALFGRWPHLREGGLKVIDVEQVRASAWSLRDMSDAAFILPDAHPSKAYLNRAVKTNLRLAVEKYIDRRAMKAAGELEGYFEEYIAREPERISPWQNDFMVLSLWLASRRGEDGAARLIDWSKNFHTGRVLSQDIDIKYAAPYQLPAKNGKTQTPVSRWADVAARLHATRADHGPGMAGYPNIATGYVAIAYASLTAIASATGAPDAFEALARYVKETKNYLLWDEFQNGGVTQGNNFLFMLTMPDGRTITREVIRRQKRRPAGNNFLIGGKADDRLTGGAASDALIGFDGDDILDGGAGPDILVGGRGNDRLTGGQGPDRLSGGAGADIFIFNATAQGATGAAQDIIVDFDPTEDKLGFLPNKAGDPAPSLQDAAATPQGALISSGASHGAILMPGVDAGALSASNFIIIQ